MTAVFPGDIKTWTARTDDVDDVMAADVNTIYEEVTAIETELGTGANGTAADLTARLAVALGASGALTFAAATTLTISGGVVTSTQNWHLLDTEGAAETDNLDTIAASTEGRVLFLRAVDGARNVVIKHAVGNIRCTGGQDITLDNPYDLAIAIYDDALDYWIVTAQSAGVLAGADNTLTGDNYLNGGLRRKSAAITSSTTLAATHQIVYANAASNTITVALPAAASHTGRTYTIVKTDASANAVTVDADGSETINGALTYALSAQFAKVTLHCNGTEWFVIG